MEIKMRFEKFDTVRYKVNGEIGTILDIEAPCKRNVWKGRYVVEFNSGEKERIFEENLEKVYLDIHTGEVHACQDTVKNCQKQGIGTSFDFMNEVNQEKEEEWREDGFLKGEQGFMKKKDWKGDEDYTREQEKKGLRLLVNIKQMCRNAGFICRHVSLENEVTGRIHEMGQTK